MQQPGTWSATEKTGGVWDGTKAMVFTGEILGASRGSYSPERNPWPIITSYQGDNTGGTGFSYNLQCGSGQRGLTLSLTDIGGRIRNSLWAQDDSGKECSCILCV